MPVFHSQRLIHIHNPRCGGSSINAVLWRNESPKLGKLRARPANYHLLYGLHRLPDKSVMELDHLDYCEVKAAVAPWVWEDYRKFVVVRHPWDKFVSEYRRKHQRGDRRYLSADKPLAEYCADFLNQTKDVTPQTAARLGRHQFADSHFIPQWRFAATQPDSLDNEVTLLRLETLDEAWPAFLLEHGLDPAIYILPRMNSQAGKYSPVELQVSPDLAARIEAFYADDYRAFGYEPRFDAARY